MIRIIGLTGGIASGKSTVSAILKNLGAFIIDADQVSRKVVQKGNPALEDLKAYFGEEILLEDGNLNRKKLGEKVFSNNVLLKKLNDITHPRINKEIISEINWYKENHEDGVIILDAALLIEMGLTNLVDELWLVALPNEIQRTRLVEREGLTEDDADKRIAAQLPLDEKKKYANIVIDNSKDIVNLKLQIEENWNRVIENI